jgi:outer membrane protein TolC
VIALLNNKISQIDFEGQLQNLVKEIGELYWDFYLAYEEYAAEVKVRKLAQKTWDEVKSKLRAGIEGGGAADEAQAADAFFDAQARTEAALSNIYLTETRLRRLIGLTSDDDLLLRPTDAPQSGDVHPDRLGALQEAYSNRLELRRQKTNLESLRLQWKAARSLVNPRVDFIADYRLNGFGKNLIARNTSDGVTQDGFNSAYDSLFRGSEATWDIGVEVSVPVFLRAERAQLRQLEFKLAKAQAALAGQEAEIAHELTYTFQQIQRWLAAVESNRHRVAAARRRAEASQADYDAGRATLDLLLRAQANESQADVAYHRSLAEYNKALWDLQYRSGTILMQNRILLEQAMPSPDLASSR